MAAKFVSDCATAIYLSGLGSLALRAELVPRFRACVRPPLVERTALEFFGWREIELGFDGAFDCSAPTVPEQRLTVSAHAYERLGAPVLENRIDDALAETLARFLDGFLLSRG